ncbi:ABC transporter [Plasmodium vivax Mauritania I]|uniref:ABC transporter n=1 Tax=Plasmodium vivax Mauritania I TaxID=1035515 RepID=A0A0J9T612_PLAVI|nr:ABC transporter [Plasmodium vivax Mauritania I]
MFVELLLCLLTWCYALRCKGLQISKYKNQSSFLSSLHAANVARGYHVYHLKRETFGGSGALRVRGEKRGQALLGGRSERAQHGDEEDVEEDDEEGVEEVDEEGVEEVDEEDVEEDDEDDEVDDAVDDAVDDDQADVSRLERLATYERLLNAEGEEDDQMLSPKYNMNIYNVLEKHYEQKEESKEILTVHNLNYEISNKKLITNLNFHVHKSECVGLIGNNGCGKTSLLNLIFDHSDNSNKSIIINNKVAKDEVKNFSLTEENMQTMVKKNKFDFLYKILHHMKMNSLELSQLPSIVKGKDVSYFERVTKKKGGNENDLFFKNGIFYFKQNIHLLEKNNLTVFEKVLKFYQPVLDKYEVLNYIEREISSYKNLGAVQRSNRGATGRGGEECPVGDSPNGEDVQLKGGSYTAKKNVNMIECVESKAGGAPPNEQAKSLAESFANSKLLQMVLKLYMHEKEHVFKEINQVKMNFHKYLNILNLKNLLHVKLSNLSNGYIIRVYLLLLLLSNAKLLLIDEINNNLDIFNIFFVMNIFHYSLKYKEIGIVLASHDFFLVSKLCNRILDFNKIYGHDIDFNNMALLKRISRSGHQAVHSDVAEEVQRKNEQNSNITFFKGNYTQYLHSMKILFDNRRKKKEELKKIMDQLSAAINQVKKKKKNEFMHQSLKKKEEEFKLYQSVYSTLFDSTLNYQYMYYNLIYSRKGEKGGVQAGRENLGRVGSGAAEGNSSGEEKAAQQAAYQTAHHAANHGAHPEEGVESLVYNSMKDVEGDMNKNILIDMSKKIKNNELIETGERYAKNNVSLYEFDNFSFYFWNRKKKKKKYIFKNMNLSISSGENVLLLGKNGIGKSTFFKILTNRYKFQMGTEGGRHRRSAYAYGDSEDEEEVPQGGVYLNGGKASKANPTKDKMANFEGKIHCNFDNVLLTYFEQNMIKKLHLEINEYFRYLIEQVNYEPVHFDDGLDVDRVDAVMENYEGSNFNSGILSPSAKEHFFFYVLNKTKPFCNEQDVTNIEEKIKALLKIFYIDSSTCMKDKSGGEKVRILFLSLFLKKSNLLLLDEINNNLDIYLKNLLLNFLNYIYQGSYILTTHDFYMIKNLTNVHKVVYIFDYQNVFTFYNVQDFIRNFYHFVLHSFDTLHQADHPEQRQERHERQQRQRQPLTEQTEQLPDSPQGIADRVTPQNSETANNPPHNERGGGHPYADPQEEEEKQNRENYDQILYDNYDYKILQFLKTQYEKDRNERENFEQITDHEEGDIFEKKKVNRKNFGGKGSSGKIKIKNWKRWKK